MPATPFSHVSGQLGAPMDVSVREPGGARGSASLEAAKLAAARLGLDRAAAQYREAACSAQRAAEAAATAADSLTRATQGGTHAPGHAERPNGSVEGQASRPAAGRAPVVPASFVCPISHLVMRHPVCVATGHYYF